MILKLKRTPGIYVVGFAGAGKTTVGSHLAERLGWSFYDTDAEIEAAERASIAGILASRGESEFRRIEAALIGRHVSSIERGCPVVLALGSGAFTLPENRLLLANNGITVWLDCPWETVRRRVAGADAFAGLYHARRDHYRLADVHVAIASDDPEIIVAAILANQLFR